MLIRVLSAIIGIPLLVYIIYSGGMVLTAAVTIVALIGLKEFYDIFNNVWIYPFKIVGCLTGTAIVILTGIQGEKAAQIVPLLLILGTIICFTIMVFRKDFRIVDLGTTLLGIVYVSIFLSVILMIYNLEKGGILLWLVFVIAWSGDTIAYFTGLSVGKHKLSPAISPKKSVEGSIGGLIGSTVGAVMLGIAAQKWGGIEFNAVSYIAIGLSGGFFSQLGDLAASVVKRYAGVKDFGKLIPGHGGILDRFDSILFTAPIVYIYIKYFF